MKYNHSSSNEKSFGYDNETMLNQYLLFHYGSEEDQLPFAFGPHESLNFPTRCITECLNPHFLQKDSTALDLGCAVGRSTFELSRFCHRTLGVDNSKKFIQAAKQLQMNGQIEYSIREEGEILSKRIAHLPQGIDPTRVDFICTDVMEIFQTNQTYSVVLAANIICRLHDPKLFLDQIHLLVESSGQLIITTPYSWLEEFTPKAKWLNKNQGLNEIKNILDKQFDLLRAFNMPFLMREHLRKYQWGVSQASIWIRK